MFPEPYIPRVLCSLAPIFQEPYLPRILHSQGFIFPVLYILRFIYFKSHVFWIFWKVFLESFVTRAIYTQSPMYTRHNIPRAFFPRGLYSLGLILPNRIFQGSILQRLFVHRFYVLYSQRVPGAWCSYGFIFRYIHSQDSGSYVFNSYIKMFLETTSWSHVPVFLPYVSSIPSWL